MPLPRFGYRQGHRLVERNNKKLLTSSLVVTYSTIASAKSSSPVALAIGLDFPFFNYLKKKYCRKAPLQKKFAKH